MNRAELLRKLLPGFIPLFVFIAADEIWGTKTGLIVAIGVGLLELGWVGYKEKRFDKFILFDTFLLIILGVISIVLDNDIFFKLKPGLIELILVAVLAVSSFSSINVIEIVGRRYLKELKFNKLQEMQMRRSMQILFCIFAAHTLLVFYATFFMSNEAWAFISGGLFYLLFAFYFLFELVRQRKKRRSISTEEIIPLVDENGTVIGQAPRSSVHNGSKLLHPVVHLHVINSGKAILLQRRPESKLIQPGKWDTAVGGHISFEETLEQALKKEAYEEIGLTGFSATHLKTYIWHSDVETELVYLFVTIDNKKYNIHSDEVDEARFWTKNQIENQIGKYVFTPNFEHEFNLLKEMKIIE